MSGGSPTNVRSPAEWFVALDANRGADRTEAGAWLDAADDNADALARCATAAAIARGLADDPELRWAYDEAAAIARGEPRAHATRVRRRLLLGWSAAGLSVAAVAIALSLRAPQPPAEPGGEPRFSRAAQIVATAAPIAPVVMLPGSIAVDANSVAVLPFALIEGAVVEGAGADTATLLQRAVVADLAMVPGVYVLGGASVEPYAGADYSAAEIGALLGARGILTGQVERSAAGVHVHAQLADAATNRIVWRADYDAAPGELRNVRTELVDGVVTALVDPTLRRSALLGASPARADNTLASIAEPAADR